MRTIFTTTDERSMGNENSIIAIQPTTNREQYQTCLNIAEVRTDGAARAEPSLIELCRVVTEGAEVRREVYQANL